MRGRARPGSTVSDGSSVPAAGGAAERRRGDLPRRGRARGQGRRRRVPEHRRRGARLRGGGAAADDPRAGSGRDRRPLLSALRPSRAAGPGLLRRSSAGDDHRVPRRAAGQGPLTPAALRRRGVGARPGARTPLLVILGPTAVGKSELAVLACERFGGEILSVDSMQVYQGLDRGTAKPEAAILRRVPHHGLDLAEPGADFSMGDFVRYAERTIAAIRGRRRLPVLVGGTGLYLRGLLKGIVPAPRRREDLRVRLRLLAERRGAPFLHRLLRRVDPRGAAGLRPGDRQRLVRALEVYFETRRGLEALIRETPFGEDRFPSVKIGLNMDRETLYRIIDARVERFFAAGLGDEVRNPLPPGDPPAANPVKAVRYRGALRAPARGGVLH